MERTIITLRLTPVKMNKGYLFQFVAPAKAGVQPTNETVQCTDKTAFLFKPLDSGLRRNGEI
jgi:hypothetical protein